MNKQRPIHREKRNEVKEISHYDNSPPKYKSPPRFCGEKVLIDCYYNTSGKQFFKTRLQLLEALVRGS